MRCGYRVAAAVGAVVNVGAGATVGGVAFGIGVNTGGLVPGETGIAALLLPGALAVGAAGTRGTPATPDVDDEPPPHATSSAVAAKNVAELARKSLMQAAWP